jgi:hypothetical protein
MSRATKLQTEADRIRAEMAEIAQRPARSTSVVLMAHLHAQLTAVASQLSELSTRRLVWLTWGLLLLTAGLLGFAIFTYEKPSETIKACREHHYRELQYAQPPPLHSPVKGT